MFNQYIEMTEKNADIIIANSVIENLKFIIISLDTIFNGDFGVEFYNEDYTFYFYHLQNAFTSCGNIINVFLDKIYRNSSYNARAKYLQETFGVYPNEYECIFNKDFRNANEHFDERYDLFRNKVGDYNVIGINTESWISREIISNPHLRTLDIRDWTYITYNRKGEQIKCDLRQLREEAHDLLYKISMHPRLKGSRLTHIPTKKIIK